MHLIVNNFFCALIAKTLFSWGDWSGTLAPFSSEIVRAHTSENEFLTEAYTKFISFIGIIAFVG